MPFKTAWVFLCALNYSSSGTMTASQWKTSSKLQPFGFDVTISNFCLPLLLIYSVSWSNTLASLTWPISLLLLTNWRPVTIPLNSCLYLLEPLWLNDKWSCCALFWIDCDFQTHKYLCLQHYVCSSELPVPRIAVTFSLQEVEEIEKECAVYRGRLERIAKHSATSREKQVLRHISPTCNIFKSYLKRKVRAFCFICSKYW